MNRQAIITGGSSGLGLASAEALAREGFDIWLLARGEKRLMSAAENLAHNFPSVRITPYVIDVSDFDQVREFAIRVNPGVSVLMNNAGLMGPDFALSKYGIESQMATNHLGHFLLTNRLWDKLDPKSGRVVSISSVVHRRSRLRADSVEEIRGSGNYDRWARYADSKLACLLFAKELDVRAKQAGSKISSIAAHPGWALTGLQEKYPNPFDFLAQDAKTGARSQIRAALDSSLLGGEFIGPKYEAWGEPKKIKGSKHSQQLDLMKRLWEISEELTGERFLG